MTQLADLVKWIVTYAVAEGFWHFIAVWMIVRAITRIFGFVRVHVHAAKSADK